MSAKPDHDQDFYSWTQHNATLLRTGRFSEADIEYIAEELEDMGQQKRYVLEGLLRIVLLHLLKWQFQPSRRSRSWQISIKAHRERALRLLDRNKGLASQLAEIIDDAYILARVGAMEETGLDIDIFPETCPYSSQQVLDQSFLP